MALARGSRSFRRKGPRVWRRRLAWVAWSMAAASNMRARFFLRASLNRSVSWGVFIVHEFLELSPRSHQ